MEQKASVNVAEKKRLRDRIDEQVRRFLDSGGSITVIDSPRIDSAPKGSAWQMQGDGAPMMD